MATVQNALTHERTASGVQGWVLVSTSWLSVIASSVIAPVLPKISQHFQDDPRVAVLTSFVATLPALFVALLAAPFGLLADRVGHKRVLIWGVAVYGFCGMAPMWLNSLRWIVVSRAGVGITEAIIMTCGTALLGDYFRGDEREKWLAYQTGTATIVAVILVAAGGTLGEAGWRMPFAVYGFGFLLLPLVLSAIWEPHRSRIQSQPDTQHKTDKDEKNFRWGGLALICLVTVFASTAFYIVIIQLSFILTERGIVSPSRIGMGSAMAALAVPVGAIVFRLLKLPVAGKLTLSFALSSIGFFIIAFSHGFATTVAGAAVNSVGSGMVLPTLITWALSKLTPEVRGRGTGAWQASMFFGQFVSPLIVLGLKGVAGSLAGAVLIYAVCCSVAAAVALALFVRSGRLATLQNPQPRGA